MTQLKRFFQWLAWQPGYRSRFDYSDAEYFNLSDKDTRIATAQREQRVPTLEQIKYVIQTMPTETEIERRNRALVAFTLLTGARDSAIASMKLKHIDLIDGCVRQDAREVKTKFSKSFNTYFFPVGDEPFRIVEAWVSYLREEKLWGTDDPLFRVLQEALHNGVMHSGVQKFSVQLWGESDEIHLRVSDSGVGFDLRAARRGRGLGPVRIEQRVKLVEGTSSIDSQPEKGTTVKVSLPLRSGRDSMRAAG